VHEFGTELATAFDVVHSIDARGPVPPRDLISLWLDVDHLHRELSAALRRLAEDAAEAVLAAVGEGGEWESAEGELVHLTRGYAKERWAGFDLVDRLAAPLIDGETGEFVRSVPVDVLRRFIPGCADPELGSSKWRTTGLAEIVPDWRRYRSRESAPWVLRRGGKP
jgi:hypothetical protein